MKDRLTYRDSQGRIHIKSGLTVQDAYNMLLEVVCNMEDYIESQEKDDAECQK